LALFGPSSGNSTESAGLFTVTEKRSKYKPKKPTAPSAVIPGQTGGEAPDTTSQELPPIFGLGQGILKGLLTSSAGSIEVVDAVLKGMKNPPILGGEFVTPNIPGNVARNVKALWGPDDVFAPGAWDDLKTGEDVLRDTLGVKDETAQFWGGLALDIAADPLLTEPLG